MRKFGNTWLIDFGPQLSLVLTILLASGVLAAGSPAIVIVDIFDLEVFLRGRRRVLLQIDHMVRLLQLTAAILYLGSCHVQVVVLLLHVVLWFYLIVAGVFSWEGRWGRAIGICDRIIVLKLIRLFVLWLMILVAVTLEDIYILFVLIDQNRLQTGWSIDIHIIINITIRFSADLLERRCVWDVELPSMTS